MSSVGSGALKSWQISLSASIKGGEEERIRELLREGAAEHFNDKNDARGALNKAILQAIGSRHESLTGILLQEGADANATSETGVPALHRVRNSISKISSRRSLADVDLFQAAWLAKERLVTLLLQHNANIEARVSK